MHAIHSHEEILKVRTLEVLDVIQVIKALRVEDPAAYNGQSFWGEEHVLAWVASGPESALAKTFITPSSSSAHCNSIPRSPLRSGVLTSITLRMTSPVAPLIEITSPALNTSLVSLTVTVSSTSLQIKIRATGVSLVIQPRATTAA
eukprot:CCRYP_020924-RE/>CCRYP_020924-RE protein AED:0.36 eAED:0.36 QI:0/0.66/0.5/1/0/0/4/1898/145